MQTDNKTLSLAFDPKSAEGRRPRSTSTPTDATPHAPVSRPLRVTAHRGPKAPGHRRTNRRRFQHPISWPLHPGRCASRLTEL